MRIVDAAFEPRAYIEQLRSADLSFGTYLIPAGGTDDQSPHAEDEIYVVTRGSAKIVTPGETADVGPGAVIFVQDHQFEMFALTVARVTVKANIYLIMAICPGIPDESAPRHARDGQQIDRRLPGLPDPSR
jgi:hypothetical protein